MADFEALFERLKKNKLVLPALAVGGIAGAYVLFKNGGISASGESPQDGSTGNIGDQPSNTAPGYPSTDSGATDAEIQALKQQQESFSQSLVDQFNALTQSVSNAISGNQNQVQSAIDALSQQQQNLQGQLGAQLANSQPALPDFSSLFASLASIPAQQNTYKSPGISLGLPTSLSKLSIKPAAVSGKAQNPTLARITGRSATSIKPPSILKPAPAGRRPSIGILPVAPGGYRTPAPRIVPSPLRPAPPTSKPRPSPIVINPRPTAPYKPRQIRGGRAIV